MARPREFDVEAVLREAMNVFWEKGFDGASFADIEERTGVKKASLFAAYGDKHSLFLKALQSYQEMGRDMARRQLAASSPKVAIRKWFAAWAAIDRQDDCVRRGCFQVNAVVERARHDAEVLALSREHTSLLLDIVAEVVKRGQKAGEFRTDVPASALAKFLVTSLHGLSVASKAGLSGQDIDRVADITLSALEP
jgi:TetR/AcrR family transcriptional regulator, transcriptional repressor for nem operon